MVFSSNRLEVITRNSKKAHDCHDSGLLLTDKKFPTTPPPRKKHQAGSATPVGSNLQPDNFPLTKSKSHESQLANRIESSSEVNLSR